MFDYSMFSGTILEYAYIHTLNIRILITINEFTFLDKNSSNF